MSTSYDKLLSGQAEWKLLESVGETEPIEAHRPYIEFTQVPDSLEDHIAINVATELLTYVEEGAGDKTTDRIRLGRLLDNPDGWVLFFTQVSPTYPNPMNPPGFDEFPNEVEDRPEYKLGKQWEYGALTFALFLVNPPYGKPAAYITRMYYRAREERTTIKPQAVTARSSLITSESSGH